MEDSDDDDALFSRLNTPRPETLAIFQRLKDNDPKLTTLDFSMSKKISSPNFFDMIFTFVFFFY